MAKKPLLIVGGALIVVLVAVLSVVATVIIIGRRDYTSIMNQEIEYATEGIIILSDEDAQSQAADTPSDAEWRSIWLNYSPRFYSSNGRDFTGTIGNDVDNGADMFVAIYTDSTYSDRLFTSKLLRPGTAFDGFRLDRRLDPGDYDLNVAFTLVATEDGAQKIVGQQVVVAEFHVTG